MDLEGSRRLLGLGDLRLRFRRDWGNLIGVRFRDESAVKRHVSYPAYSGSGAPRTSIRSSAGCRTRTCLKSFQSFDNLVQTLILLSGSTDGHLCELMPHLTSSVIKKGYPNSDSVDMRLAVVI